VQGERQQDDAAEQQQGHHLARQHQAGRMGEVVEQGAEVVEQDQRRVPDGPKGA
jgi:hypothetical protein